MDKFKSYFKYIGIAGCVIALIGAFVPWMSAMGYTATLINRLGIYFILLIIAAGALFLLDSALFALISAILSAAWLAVNAFTLFSNKYLIIAPSAGLYIMIAGLLVMFIASILMLIYAKKETTNGQF